MFREGTCPKCHQVIQVPDDREKVICMYCGEEIRVDEALGAKEEVKEIDREAYQEYFDIARNELEQVILTCYNPMENFKKNLYEGEFEAYYAGRRALFEALDQVYRNDENPEESLQKLVEHLIQTAQDELQEIRFKGRRTQRQLDYNFLISVYLVPSMMKYPAEFSEPFADCLIKQWNRTFQTSLGKATYDDINKGFRRKLCYITTAVCEGLDKGSDCAELELLKAYRDQYMEATPEGRAMVDEYYDIAPTIVKRIEKDADSRKVYQELYENYLVPCIHLIQDGQYEACRDTYQEMVLELKNRYMHQN